MTMEHIEKNILEKYIISRENFTPGELDNITAHLAHCAYCKDHAEKLTAFYDSVSKEMQNNPTERDKAFVEKLLVPKGWITTRNRLALPEKKLALQERVDNALSTFVEIIEPYHRPLAQRIVRYIQLHPVKTTVRFSMAACLVGLALFFAKPFKDTNPEYARAKDEFLVVYNKNGNELWRKYIGIGYDLEKLRVQEPGFDPNNYLQTIDVDGDGKKEVIAIFGMLSEWQPKNIIYCYTPDGKEQWTYRFNRQMTFGNKLFDDTYNFRNILVGDFDKNGSIEIIAVISHGGWFPTAIVNINAQEGILLNEYWHSGSIHRLINRDLDNDGIEEIIATGENNGFNLASVFVIDPRNFQGHSPAPEEYTPKNISIGNEKYYLLVNRSDLQEYSSHQRNRARGFWFNSDGSLIVTVTEEIERTEYTLLYFFSPTLQCINVDGEDKFVTLRNKFIAEGKLTKKLDAQYYEDLRKGVQYWNGDKFVYTPTMNKKYVEVAMRLP